MLPFEFVFPGSLSDTALILTQSLQLLNSQEGENVLKISLSRSQNVQLSSSSTISYRSDIVVYVMFLRIPLE